MCGERSLGAPSASGRQETVAPSGFWRSDKSPKEQDPCGRAKFSFPPGAIYLLLMRELQLFPHPVKMTPPAIFRDTYNNGE